MIMTGKTVHTRALCRLAALLAAFALLLAGSTEARADSSYEEYQELVKEIEEQKPFRQLQLYRVDAAGNKLTGICNACAVTTLLNRRLAYDGKTGEDFTIYDVFEACGVIVKAGPIAWKGSEGAETGYVYKGDTGHWSKIRYTNGAGTSYQAVRVDAEDVMAEVEADGSFSNYLIRMLHEHPEGVCIRNHNANHVAVICDYAIIGGMAQFYVKDPVDNYEGRVENARIYYAHGSRSLYRGLDCIVYLKDSRPGPEPQVFPEHVVLSKGTECEHVAQLQTMLNEVLQAGLVPDGDYGPGTEEAVRKYQKQAGLGVDGMCGMATWGALTEAYRSKTEVYRVTWDANGGTAGREASVIRYGMPVHILPPPQREGFRFDGWYTAAADGERVSRRTVITQDVTFYAHWTGLPAGR